MGSTVEQVLVAVHASLLGATDAGTRVERGRADPFERGDLPALNLRRGMATTDPHGDGLEKVTLQFDVDCEVRGDDWETLADALHMQVSQQLKSSSPLSGLIRGLRCISTEPTGEGGDETAGRITARYQAYFLQRQG